MNFHLDSAPASSVLLLFHRTALDSNPPKSRLHRLANYHYERSQSFASSGHNAASCMSPSDPTYLLLLISSSATTAMLERSGIRCRFENSTHDEQIRCDKQSPCSHCQAAGLSKQARAHHNSLVAPADNRFNSMPHHVAAT